MIVIFSDGVTCPQGTHKIKLMVYMQVTLLFN